MIEYFAPAIVAAFGLSTTALIDWLRHLGVILDGNDTE